MAKNLKRWQNEQLGTAESPAEKFKLLEDWLEKGEISESQYNFSVNKIINRTMKSVKPSVDINDRAFYRTSAEAKLQSYLEFLRRRLTAYLKSRHPFDAKLSVGEVMMFKRYLEEYPYIKSKINRLLIVGLRYPDKEINEIAEEFILKHKIYSQINHADYAFWLMLWEDGNLVPMNAVRLMLNNTEKGFELKPCFKHDTRLMEELKPLIEFQRDKEILRLEWAKSLKDKEKREAEVERKQRRLDTFECLLKLF